jgi:cobalt-zinc-cadmium efflux system membrane fusion protein
MTGKNKLMILLALIAGIAIGMILMGIVFSNPESANKGVEAVQNEQSDHTEKSGEEHGGEVARLSDEELQEFGIELTTAGPGKLQIHTDLTGEIVIDPDRLAHIVPRFPGVVKEVRKKIGDKVRKGEVIAIIESNESLALYEVTSLIDGTVIEMHMTRGEVIEDAGHAVVVADLSHVWVNLSVYQKDLPYMREGQPVVITAGPGIPDARGKVSYLTPVVDEHTRTATARVILPNPDGRWKPGLFVNGRFICQWTFDYRNC